jgi:hypothetical protein
MVVCLRAGIRVFLGPPGSVLTAAVVSALDALATEADPVLMVSPAASSVAIFNTSRSAVGVLQPSTQLMPYVLTRLHAAGARTVAFVAQPANATLVRCYASRVHAAAPLAMHSFAFVQDACSVDVTQYSMMFSLNSTCLIGSITQTDKMATCLSEASRCCFKRVGTFGKFCF